MPRWQPIASMVMIAPSIESISRSLGMAMISLDFSATLTWPSTSRWRAAKAETMWMAALAPFFWTGTADRLAVDGDHVGRRPGQSCRPSDEAALEPLRVERGQDVAQMVVGRCAVAKRPEASQKRNLLLSKARYVDDGFSASKDCHQAQQQHFIERVDHFPALTRVRQISEMLQKNQGLAHRPAVSRSFHRHPPQNRIRGSRQIQPFSPLSRSSSPDCPESTSAVG